MIGVVLGFFFGVKQHSISNQYSEPSWEVIVTAVHKDYEYPRILSMARQGDEKALLSLFRFCKFTDAAASYSHGIVLIDLINVYGDAQIAQLISKDPDHIKFSMKVVLE